MSKSIKQLNARSTQLAKSAATLSSNIHAHCVEIVEHVIECGDVSAFTFLYNAIGNSAVRKQALVDWIAAYGGGKFRDAHDNKKTGKREPAKFTRNDVPVTQLSVEAAASISPFDFSKETVQTVNAINLESLVKGLIKRVEEGKDKIPTKKDTKHNIPAEMLAGLKGLIATADVAGNA